MQIQEAETQPTRQLRISLTTKLAEEIKMNGDQHLLDGNWHITTSESPQESDDVYFTQTEANNKPSNTMVVYM